MDYLTFAERLKLLSNSVSLSAELMRDIKSFLETSCQPPTHSKSKEQGATVN